MKFDIENYARDNLDKFKITSTGELTAVCPWCNKYGAFYINKETGNFICFKCETKGLNLFGVVAQIEGISLNEARNFIFKNSIKFRRKETTRSLLDWIKSLRKKDEKEEDYFSYDEEEEKKVIVDLPEGFIPVFKNGVWKYPNYLKERKIKREVARTWNLGFCNSGFYSGRIIIPIECPNGKSFAARDATGKQKPKILYPKNAKQSSLLLGWNFIKPDCDIIICEGPFDALKLYQNGFSPLALLGKVLHAEQKNLLLSRSNESAIFIMLDPEELEAPFFVARQLMNHFEKIFIAKLPENIDPGLATRKQVLKTLEEAKKFNGWTSKNLSFKLEEAKKNMDFMY